MNFSLFLQKKFVYYSYRRIIKYKMNTLQDILGLITKGKVKPPKDKDYFIVASYGDSQEVLMPQPKMQANLVGVGALKKFIEEGISPTKEYAALVTQVGTYPNVVWPGPFVIGNTYIIQFLISPDDFSNIGYVANGTPFVATGTTPTVWGQFDSQVREIPSSSFPSFEVINNTLGITLTPSYRDTQSFFLDSNLPVFIANKTFVFPQSTITNDLLATGGFGLSRISDSRLCLSGYTIGNTAPFTIKIEIYN